VSECDDDLLVRRGVHWCVGIGVRQHLPGVGGNFQDHVALYCAWESQVPLSPRNNMVESTVYSTISDSETPDVFICQVEAPGATGEFAARFELPASGWSLGVVWHTPRVGGTCN
jgi:choline dehydrogenase-like flavoprotein